MSSPPDFEVLVVGAGPVGCWVAAELCAAGVQVLVVEARENRAAWSRGFVVHPRTLEIFDSRGAAAPMLAASRRLPTWHFAMGSSRLDFAVLPTSFPFILLQPQAQTEEILEEHLNRCGGAVLRGRRVLDVRQEPDRVVARILHDGAEQEVSARFVVGCDGAHSTVRTTAGIGFSGTPDTMVSPAALAELADPPPPEQYMQGTEQGLLFLIPLPDGRFVISTIDHAVMTELKKPWTAQMVRDSLLRISGTDYGLGEVERVSTLGNAALQADRYRDGRVLLAGDAAHVHFPMGGQGMNLGIQDAHNLAWRLIAAVRAERDGDGHGAEAADALLDGYEAERRPAGERVLEDVHAQMGLVSATGADGAALRARFEALLAEHPAVNLQYARRLSGIAVRYPTTTAPATTADGADGVVVEDVRLGARVPDLLLERDGAPPVQLYELLREIGPGRFVRLTIGDHRSGNEEEGTAALTATGVRGPDWAVRDGWDHRGSVLIRPDGHVAEARTW
ncbi:monooxygenase FAD-binding [Catenulispora acidiphila DSM 44928]|uniref:Monooxygenase FAD-binding n=1 Tax=Catenulispora acidiphila (strain DSM 44928 / JCM 14897 / NBRC 102108 / NRRL B-24433 / ID139908) TaxID=479433 RepID=C7Q7Q9_CATAD|nr:FAD-dependent monooxygenase [Catenulispora acidiphila]ACU72252.1 monooxygenase FAD-binding [Catenulispora acidiphila DSM 44928]